MYFALLNFSFLFNMVLDFGINNFNNRAVSTPRKPAEQTGTEYFHDQNVAVRGLSGRHSGFLHWLPGSGASNCIYWVFLRSIRYWSLLYCISGPIWPPFSFFKTDAVISVLDRVLMIIIIGAVLWSNVTGIDLSIRFFVYAQTASYALAAVIAFIALQLKAPGLKLSLDVSLFKKILKLSYPFALLGILMMIYNRIDGIMIERLLGTEGQHEAGIYAASFRLLDVLNMVGFAFASLLLPVYSRMLKQKEDYLPLLKLSYKSILFIAVSVACISFVFRHEIMGFLYPESDTYWAGIFGWLMISFTGIGTMYIYGSLLTANGNLRQLNYIGLGGVLLNVGLNYFLIMEYRAMGAVIATVATQLLVAAMHLLAAFRAFQFRPDMQLIIRCVIFIPVAAGFSYLTTFLPLAWSIQMILAIMSLVFDWISCEDVGL